MSRVGKAPSTPLPRRQLELTHLGEQRFSSV